MDRLFKVFTTTALLEEEAGEAQCLHRGTNLKKELRVTQLFSEYIFKILSYFGAAAGAGGALSASNFAFHLVPSDHERGVTVSAQSL